MSNWYIEVPVDEAISQGDILFNCPIVISSPELDPASPDKVGEVHNLVDTADVIVLTQACDLEDCSVRTVILALLRDPLTMRLRKEFDNPAQDRNERIDLFKKIHRGEIPNYAVIPEYKGVIMMGYRYIDFSEIFTMPFDFLMQLREHLGTRLRLNTPHRELISQKFGNFFARIGIPHEDHIQRDRVAQDLFPKIPKS